MLVPAVDQDRTRLGVHELLRGDRMLQQVDLTDGLNAHIAQGVIAAHGIVMMSAGELTLVSGKTLLVAMMRSADQATLIVDSGKSLERSWCVIPAPRPRRPVWRGRPEKHLSLDISM